MKFIIRHLGYDTRCHLCSQHTCVTAVYHTGQKIQIRDTGQKSCAAKKASKVRNLVPLANWRIVRGDFRGKWWNQLFGSHSWFVWLVPSQAAAATAGMV